MPFRGSQYLLGSKRPGQPWLVTYTASSTSVPRGGDGSVDSSSIIRHPITFGPVVFHITEYRGVGACKRCKTLIYTDSC